MSFHLGAYTVLTAGAITDSGANAATDPEISQRNNHYIFTEDYRMLADAAFGATLTRANWSIPTWNQYTKMNLWPVNRSLTIPSPPQMDYWGDAAPPIPKNEELSLLLTDTALEQITAFIWLAPTNFSQNLPRGIDPVPVLECRVNFTASSITANQWSGLQALTFEQSLRGGVYAVVGAEFQGANLLAFRLVFPRAPIYHTRKLRPGGLCSSATGDLMAYNLPKRQYTWGEWGRFSTFEPPQIEFWIITTGTPVVEGRLWLVRITDGMDVQYAA